VAMDVSERTAWEKLNALTTLRRSNFTTLREYVDAFQTAYEHMSEMLIRTITDYGAWLILVHGVEDEHEGWVSNQITAVYKLIDV